MKRRGRETEAEADRATAAPAPSLRRRGPGDGLAELQRAVGNQGMRRLLESGRLQAKLVVSEPTDADEIEADRVAERVARKATPAATTPAAGPDASARGGGAGRALDLGVRREMEAGFGEDFRAVRIHDDSASAAQAEALQARAFTVGTDVFFGRDEFAPTTMRGRTLLAHELAHVVQQRAGTRAQRDKVPVEFQKSMDVAGMSDADLHARYDAIVQVLATFTTSGPETALLEQELGRIGAELVQRAIGAGRTFGKPAVEAARKYFMDNAKKSKPDSCIIALNKGLKLFTAKTDLPTTPKTIERSMEKVVAAGFATGPREIQFTARGGKITHGGARPHALAESVWDALIAMTGGDFGVSVFTMSLMDGDHSVTLTLDRTDPGQPHVYWSDQWSSKGGWKEYDRAGLDAEVTRLIQGWWDDQPEGKKFNTVIRLWRMRSQSATAAAPVAPSP